MGARRKSLVFPRFVYGLFNGEACEYVGSGYDVTKIIYRHTRKGAYLNLNPSWTLRVLLRECYSDEENRLINFFKSKGQARLNKNPAWPLNKIRRPSSYRIKCSNGLTFVSLEELGRYLRICAGTVKRIFSHYDCEYEGLTFRWSELL